MHHHSIEQAHSLGYEIFIVVTLLIAVTLYIGAGVNSSTYKPLRKWPLHRHFCFALAMLCIGLPLIGPLARQAHTHFTAHMLAHLLLGMLSPLLITLAAPITLLLRTIHVTKARRLVVILHSWPFRIVSHPIVASSLNIGGLWLLYRTHLYEMMQSSSLLHWLIHIHIFWAGYVFTMSMIYIDPTPHRYSFRYRVIVFLLALAAHGMLAKYIYISPPVGVDEIQARLGGLIMYYGGDVIDVLLIFIFCLQWYRTTRPASSSWA